MIRLRHKMLIQSMRVIDQLLLAAAAVAVIHFRPDYVLQGLTPPEPDSYRISDTMGILFLALGWFAIFSYRISYKSDRFMGLARQLKDFFKATTFASFLLLLVGVLFSVESINTMSVVIFWCLVSSVGIMIRICLRLVVLGARRSGYNYRHLLVIGANERAREMAGKFINSPELGMKLVGFVAENEESRTSANGEKTLGTIDELRSILERERVDEVMICLSVESKFSTITHIIQQARELGVVARLIPDVAEGHILRKLRVEEFEDEYVVTLFREELLLQLLIKRAMDVMISSVALVVLMPMLVLLGILIKLTSPGPIFFSQERVGMNQRRFRLYKFRSMVVDAERRKEDLKHLNELDGPAFKMEKDPRITPLGHFIRKLSLDELPQFFNVLKGEMSLVGPRPPLPTEVEKYEWLFRRRLSVKPGLTCVWQVTGRSKTTFEQWMKMDQEYIENWSLWLDLKILLKTIPAVLFCRGAA